MKRCSRCKTEKSLSEFGENRSSKDGLQHQCKECRREYRRSTYVPKPKRKREKKKAIYTEEVAAKAKVRMLKYRYGLTEKEYLQMYENQNHGCAICDTKLELGTPKGLYVDHCHETNKVRGLLCSSCNSALGKFKDSTVLLKKAIEYLGN